MPRSKSFLRRRKPSSWTERERGYLAQWDAKPVEAYFGPSEISHRLRDRQRPDVERMLREAWSHFKLEIESEFRERFPFRRPWGFWYYDARPRCSPSAWRRLAASPDADGHYSESTHASWIIRYRDELTPLTDLEQRILDDPAGADPQTIAHLSNRERRALGLPEREDDDDLDDGENTVE